MTFSTLTRRCATLLSAAPMLVFLACSDSGAASAGSENSEDSVRGGTPAAPGSWWKPTSDKPIHWHWQLSDTFTHPRDVLPNVSVYDIDGELTPAATVAKLKAASPNNKAICYFDAGVWEDYRSDAGRFPKSVIGKPDVGWEGSYWLDIRQLDIIMPIMKDRIINWCKNKGFDAIEPDETEVWSNDSGFPITKEQNTAFHKALSDLAHSLNLSIGLKGNNTEADILEPYFDWALTEQCWEFNECKLFKDSFVKKNKTVFNVEYKKAPNCASANAWHINSSQRDLQVTGPKNRKYLYKPCVPDNRDTW
ncbi:endo alpha-1,4 polygalactosaminidase [Pendulispora albinea]|uniref:Endo alpha-1,4 polygalactosaminidase n=1 Tax=Pendulispora albinea TaxID=2741071 RepID=A0ABZ2LKA5_9BACT